MKAQEPAQGILRVNDWGKSKMYHVICQCGQPDHAHSLDVESDDGNVTVTIYTTVKSKWWELNRLQQVWTLLTKGYVEYETDLIMDKQTALNYAETLKSAIIDCEEFEKERKWQRDLQNRIAKRLAEENDCI